MFDGSEMMVFLVCVVFSVFYWGKWVWRHSAVKRIVSRGADRSFLILTPIACAWALFVVLTHYASSDVRDSTLYLSFYMAMGAAWVGFSLFILRLMGLDPVLDAVERHNSAVKYAYMGTMLGATLTFAGANIGDGPGWWVVVYASFLSTGGLIVAWAVLARAGCLDSLTLDRDRATGWRIGGFMIAAGLILGRGAAGDWVSGEELFTTFGNIAWAAALLMVVEVIVERMLRPTPANPAPSPLLFGAIPGLIYVGLAFIYLLMVGPWELPPETAPVSYP